MTMLNHGFSADGFLKSYLHLIPKDKLKSLRDTNNYRAIALSNILGKLLDWVIIGSNHDALNSSDLQFGFKPESSTTQCSFVRS